MTPIVPFNFDPPAADYEPAHLKFESVQAGQKVSWPLIGVNFFVPGSQHWPDHEKIELHNGSIFKFHGLKGYSVSHFHESFMRIPPRKAWYRPPILAGFKMGNVELTFGEASPLAVMLFDQFHRSKYLGEWHEITTLRVLGLGVDNAEAALACACDAYQSKFGVLPVPYELSCDFTFDDDAETEDGAPEIVAWPPICKNVDPLRFLYHGLAQDDNVSACIYFYRVLEHFSFFVNMDQMRRLRHDSQVNDADFARKIVDLISKDERRPIFKLIENVIDSEVIKSAVSKELIGKADANSLCEAVYAFRNSIVHGKWSYGFVLQSEPIIDEDPKTGQWRGILCELARRALREYGSKEI